MTSSSSSPDGPPTSTSAPDPAPGAGDQGGAEDYALVRVPLSERQSGWALSWSSTGIITTLAQITIGAYVASVAGIALGLAAGAITAVWCTALGWLMGHVSQREGLSSTVASRLHGFGARGSSLVSVIIAVSAITFIALENVLLYNGTIFLFGMEDNLLNKILIYAVLTVVWVAGSAFGLAMISRIASYLVVAFLVVVAILVWRVAAHPSFDLGEVLQTSGGAGSGADFRLAIATLAGPAGILAFVYADYSRFARRSADVGILVGVASVTVNIVVVLVGTILVFGAAPIVTEYFLAAGGTAAQADADTQALASNNTGAYFMILSSVIGFLLMYAAQIKAQILNTYASSLSLSNFFDVLIGWRPGRVMMVVIANVIALFFVGTGVLSLLGTWLIYMGIMTTCASAVVITDYFLFGGLSKDHDQSRVRAVDPCGMAAFLIGAVVSCVLQVSGAFDMSFLVAFILTALSYYVIKRLMTRPAPDPA